MKKFLSPVIFGLLIFILKCLLNKFSSKFPVKWHSHHHVQIAQLAVQQKFTLNVIQCSPCSANCDSCIDSNTCLTCSNVYTLNSNDACLYKLVCPANCSMCASNTTCATYQTGFFLALNWSCQACPISCAACFKPGMCTECADGYKLNLNTCKPS